MKDIPDKYSLKSKNGTNRWIKLQIVNCKFINITT